MSTPRADITRNQLRVANESGRGVKVKVVICTIQCQPSELRSVLLSFFTLYQDDDKKRDESKKQMHILSPT